MPNLDTDVLVVGAGPTGLLIAADLARAGVSCTVLERRTEKPNVTRAFAVHARTMEILDARGAADDLAATGTPVATLQLFGRAHIDLSRLDTRFPCLLVTPQYNTEHVLERLAREHGAVIAGGTEVTAVDAGQDGVTVTASTGSYRARFLVGADGVHSTVRQNLGLPFPGHAVLTSIMLADVRLARPPEDVLTVNANSDGFVFLAPFGDGWYRVFAWNRHHQVPDTEPVDFAEMTDLTRRVHGTDYGMHDPRWMARFHSDERQTPHYRAGRVFLAGDAAHCHSPAGGLGMNTGIQDAANLGWKLAAAVQGWAPPGLLDSYEAERHPVGKAALRVSGALVRLGLMKTPLARALRNTLGTAALALPAVNHRAAGRVSGLSIAYPHGGERARDIRLADGRRLYEALRDGTFLLAGPPAVSAGGWAGRVRAVPVTGQPPLKLIRPDGYLAWTGGEDGVTAALARWCGSPAATASARASD